LKNEKNHRFSYRHILHKIRIDSGETWSLIKISVFMQKRIISLLYKQMYKYMTYVMIMHMTMRQSARLSNEREMLIDISWNGTHTTS